ncbi:hypothetical protein GCL60_16970 (plasmid) [Silvanigrella paludirubra]|uniref:Uncharacterized protein n=1 Tax=Silvanigrella paludirubra TaxID=2499159 RepID=A0A6N6VSL0_9BACT|nr:hypothetical protein [Silvanigrella paludirubra]KAB8035640.1 hypothetical protein GCL60_16970 [Silvanigrella paludirubra]
MTIKIDNDLKANTGISFQYKQIINLIKAEKFKELNEYIVKNSLNRYYILFSERYELQNNINFHHNLYSSEIINEVEQVYPSIKDTEDENASWAKKIAKRYELNELSLAPERLLSCRSIEEISKYITGYKNAEYGLKYISKFDCMYDEEYAQILRNMYKIIDYKNLNKFFEFIENYTNGNNCHFLAFFKDINAIIAFKKLYEILTYKQIGNLFFYISEFNGRGDDLHNYAVNRNVIKKIFRVILKDGRYSGYNRTTHIVYKAINVMKYHYNNLVEEDEAWEEKREIKYFSVFSEVPTI